MPDALDGIALVQVQVAHGMQCHGWGATCFGIGAQYRQLGGDPLDEEPAGRLAQQLDRATLEKGNRAAIAIAIGALFGSRMRRQRGQHGLWIDGVVVRQKAGTARLEVMIGVGHEGLTHFH